ncbi:MAG: hypothetical protein ACO1QS_20065 [Verrucomicrobiota bacterium]
MNTSKWIVAFAGVALVAGVAIAGATRETDSGSCHQAVAKADTENCPMHAAKAEHKPMGCCEKPAVEPAGCPMHAEAKPAAASCHGGDSATAKDAPAHAGHH